MWEFVWELIGRKRTKYVIAVIILLVSIPIATMKSTVGGQIVDTVIYGEQHNMLVPLIVLLLLLALMRSVMRWWSTLAMEEVSQTAVMKLRQRMYRKLNKLHFGFFDTTRTGDIMTRMTMDTDLIRHLIAYAAPTLLENAITFLVGAAVLLFINWKMAILILLVSPFIAFFAGRMGKKVRPTYMNVRNKNAALNTTVQENISGNKVVKAFAKEDFETDKFTDKNQAFRNANIHSNFVSSHFLPYFDIAAAALGVITVLVGGYFVLQGAMTVGELVIINSLLWTINNPVRQIAWLINDVQRADASHQKITELLYKRPEIRTRRGIEYVDHVNGDVEFRNVSFRYGDEMALKNISFSVKAGQTVAIIGSTGSGKSSLVSLIPRFYQAKEGSVLIDGRDVKDWNLRTLRKYISVAQQDIFLFSDTIEGNIAYGKPNATFEEVQRAAKIANAHDFILQFPEGYDTIIGERGVGLSGGQRQRIALARAILREYSILILDDTTSSVDMETEYEIHKHLRQEFSGKTTFLIAHRISTVKDADLILVMDNGEIIERGTHDELLAQKGYYYEVFQNQLGDFDQTTDTREVNKDGAQ